ncbi:MarR family winged helix-turn-helix transcriptional regulator [Brevibacillus fulvus]|uniref:DNA-binding MarR family transcriptional regulator n=1 Tax=Brevibacillus fulvus TaxID=1125967 RepID=A0A939BTM8_9BACL|nr:MarR family transcriptional regulator [Brevibacillus fulvus]MBM7591678.1 DNA-binding MarR family transcriptional regulator [Brevibacillus fulvus]
MDKSLIIRDLLRRLNKRISTNMTKELATYGITIPQWMVIKQISEEPKSIGQISKCINLSYSTISGIIDRLEREQYVERIRDQTDRRVIWIKGTPQLEQFLQNTEITSGRFYSQLFAGLSEENLDGIIHSLQMLINKIEEKVEEKP